ncbi:MAG: nicotinamide-nucleotide adenylyltransferase [Candidatus Altiarchaeota archaeon]|nr:nicotinamide-nucleotide adenylyltransferase [Candidatus Altiarchaeota archaeon]
MSSSERPIEPLRVLVIGRFQPLHEGHVSLIEQALELGEVIIVVGSAQKDRTHENPFTCRERLEMLKATIQEKGWDSSKLTIIPVEDIHSNGLWVAKVEMLTPKFHTVMTHNKLVGQLFSEKGYVVVEPKPLHPEKFNGSKIREDFLKGKVIKGRVPKCVEKIMSMLNFTFLVQKN